MPLTGAGRGCSGMAPDTVSGCCWPNWRCSNPVHVARVGWRSAPPCFPCLPRPASVDSCSAVVAAFITSIDADLTDDLLRLTHRLEAGHRVPQPRLRHRLQEDRVGLTAYRHRLIRFGDELTFDIDEKGGAGQRVGSGVRRQSDRFRAPGRGCLPPCVEAYAGRATSTRPWSTT